MPLEVLLLEDIPGVGQQNDIIVVREGFALNNLLPRRRAIVATPTVRKRYAEQIKRRAEEKAREVDLARSAASLLKDKVLAFARKATKNGKLYAAVSERMISEALHEQLQIEVAEAAVLIKEEVKSVGMHAVRVKIAGQELDLRVEVHPEQSE